MAKVTFGPAGEFARALGIEDPENVRRIVIDVESGEHPRIYVERFVTTESKIIDAMVALMTGSRIDVTGIDKPAHPEYLPTGYHKHGDQGCAGACELTAADLDTWPADHMATAVFDRDGRGWSKVAPGNGLVPDGTWVECSLSPIVGGHLPSADLIALRGPILRAP